MNTSTNTRKLVTLGILTAVVVVLQVVATFFKVGPFSMTFALAPIIIGAALYGASSGAYLGGVFGLVVLIACIMGWDLGGNILWTANPFLTAVICLGKGIIAGFLSGAMFTLISKKGNSKVAAMVAGVVAPLCNTGLFLLGLSTFFYDILLAWAGGTAVVYYIIFGLVGVNFIVELLTNLVLSNVIVRVVGARQQGR